jgi:hypothetical protein
MRIGTGGASKATGSISTAAVVVKIDVVLGSGAGTAAVAGKNTGAGSKRIACTAAVVLGAGAEGNAALAVGDVIKNAFSVVNAFSVGVLRHKIGKLRSRRRAVVRITSIPVVVGAAWGSCWGKQGEPTTVAAGEEALRSAPAAAARGRTLNPLVDATRGRSLEMARAVSTGAWRRSLEDKMITLKIAVSSPSRRAAASSAAAAKSTGKGGAVALEAWKIALATAARGRTLNAVASAAAASAAAKRSRKKRISSNAVDIVEATRSKKRAGSNAAVKDAVAVDASKNAGA